MLVLVTGGSGFIGCHCISKLLAAGYDVRATVRDPGREADIRAMLMGVPQGSSALSFAVADLRGDNGWAAATEGCEYVLHVASPFPPGIPAHEDELIVPAREGTLRILRAARASGVRRVVLTSSFAAIGYGHPPRTAPFDERDWTVPGAGVSAYAKSKTLAERAAWQFVGEEGGGRLELAVINPVAVFGPVLGAKYSTSIGLVKRMIEGGMAGNPRLYFGVVDVRDVADLHVTAMTHPAARGERFLATAGDFMSLQDIAKVLKSGLGTAGGRIRTRELPDGLLRVAAWFNPLAREILPELGKRKSGSSAKAKELLGWRPRLNEEAILAAGESLLRLGLL